MNMTKDRILVSVLVLVVLAIILFAGGGITGSFLGPKCDAWKFTTSDGITWTGSLEKNFDVLVLLNTRVTGTWKLGDSSGTFSILDPETGSYLTGEWSGVVTDTSASGNFEGSSMAGTWLATCVSVD